MKNYLVTLVDRETGKRKRIIVQAGCPHGMQEFVETIPDLGMDHPIVVDVDEKRAARMKLRAVEG